MKLVQVLGPGCPRCAKLAEQAEAAVKQLGIAARVEKVTDMDQITSYRVMAMPALVVDGQVRLVGRLPSVEEIKKLLS